MTEFHTQMKQVPLQLFLLAHPQSQTAVLLAQELMQKFVDPPASGGLRLPVFFTPDTGDGMPPSWNGDGGIELDSATHTLVVVLADSRMVQSENVDGGTGELWKDFLEEGIRRAEQSLGRHFVFGIAVDCEGYTLTETRHMVGVGEPPELPMTNAQSDEDQQIQAEQQKRFNAWFQAAADTAALQITIRAIPLLQPQAVAASPGQRRPVKLFLSHAKADLGVADANADEADPVRNVELVVKELPIQYWFDAQDIPPAEKFEAEIQNGLQDCSIVVVFLSDQYATRPYCQWEVLVSKRLGLPMLLVDNLSKGETRSFPYLGNIPSIHWNSQDRKASGIRVVFHALRETLRYLHNRACITSFWVNTPDREDLDIILATSPEAITLSRYSMKTSQRQVFVYPDPPLAPAEREVLTSLRDADFTTPLTQLANMPRTSPVRAIAVSIADSGELARKGLSLLHEQTLTDEIYLSLLVSGFQMAYGGRLELPSAGNTDNFTLRLFGLVKRYSRLASDAGTQLAPILNIPPWPLWLTYNSRILKLFGKTAELSKGPRPPLEEIPETDETGRSLFPAEVNLSTLPDTPLRRLAWSRGLTLMRQLATRVTQARLVIGGKLEGYSGLNSGVVEEAWFSLVTRQPLYLVGFFGGAARAVIDLLEGRDRNEVSQPNLGTKAPSVNLILEKATQQGLKLLGPDGVLPDPMNLRGTLILPTRIATDIQRAGRAGLNVALNNGLSDEENQELFHSRNPQRIVELILTGLSKIQP